MTHCDEVMLFCALREEASPAYQQAVQAHLAGCRSCMAARQVESSLTRILQLLRLPHPRLLEQLIADSDQRMGRVLARWDGWLPGGPWAGRALAAVLLVALFSAGLLLNAQGGPSASETASPVADKLRPAPTATPGQTAATAVPTNPPAPAGPVVGANAASTTAPPLAGAADEPAVPTEGGAASTATAPRSGAAAEPGVPAGAGDPGINASSTAAADEQAVTETVTQFGRQLRMVSLLAPPAVLQQTMQQAYADFVSAGLLERWAQEPLQAPGRQTSSPWPARIELSELRRLSVTQYQVAGAIVEVTGPDEANAQVVNRIPIQLSLQQHQQRWLITDYSTRPGGPASASDRADERVAVQTMLNYYQAINERRYDEAYRMWKSQGASSGQSFAEFQQGYQATARVRLILDAVRPSASAPGTVEVAARVLAVVEAAAGQQIQAFQGTYILEPAGAGEQSPTSWVIRSASMQQLPAALPPDELKTAEQALTTYYEAIDRRDYALAYSVWGQLGRASGQSFSAFHAGFASTAGVSVEQGAGQQDAGAGSVYARIPVVLVATQTDGSQQAYCGFYDLQRSNLPPFDQLGWRIKSAQLVSTGPVALYSAASRQLLAGGCG